MAKQHRHEQTKRGAQRRRGTMMYHWMAVGALAASGSVPARALAQQVASAPAVPPGHAASGTATPASRRLEAMLPQAFRIPAGTLAETLGAFQKTTGVAVHIATPEMEALASPGVQGELTPMQALRRLLGTLPVVYRVQGSAAHPEITIDLARQTYSVQVTAQAPMMDSPKFSAPALNTPQTIVAIPPREIQDQAAATLQDVLHDVAGLSLAAGEGNSQGDALSIRGFTASTDIFLDGLRDTGNYYRDPFDLQQVSVLEGPSGVTFGRGSTGGVVEQDSKAPQPGRFLHADVEAGTDDSERATVDDNHSVEMFGHTAMFRLNLMGDAGHVAGRNIAENRRVGAAPALTFGLGAATQLAVQYLREAANDIPDYGIPWLFNQPAPVPRNDYYGFQDGNYLRTYDDVGTATLEHTFNSEVSFNDRARYAHYTTHDLITEPQINATAVDGGPVTPQTPLADILVTRNELADDSVETFAWDQANLSATVETGPIRHTLVAGIEGGRETADPTRTTWTGIVGTALLNPNPFQVFAGQSAPRSVTEVSAVSVGVYVLDTVTLSRHWQFTGGARWDRFNTDYNQFVAPASAFTRVDQNPTFRGALVYKPAANASLYVSASTSFDPSAESLSLSAATANLPPETGRTYEAGGKWNLGVRPLALNASVFETDMNNVREPDPNDPLADVLSGEQRVRGIQLGVSGHLAPAWDLDSGYAFLDGDVIRSAYYPRSVGEPLANVPRHTFNAWLTHYLARGVRVGAGSNFVASRTASSTAPLDPTTGLLKQAPGYWLFNAMASYRLSERAQLQINVDNLFNRAYAAELHNGHVIPGPGRVALIGFHFEF